ncbi:MAG: hypothetical protein IKC11_01950 [Clostridia bacterium]|nr:hypothetical protein [Clostridia bacterium]
MNKYFRITGYSPENDFCFILDSFGMFDEIWQFSSFLIKNGFKVLEVSNAEQFVDINIEKVEENAEKVFLRANAKGKPENIQEEIEGITYKAIKVADKIYIPKK